MRTWLPVAIVSGIAGGIATVLVLGLISSNAPGVFTRVWSLTPSQVPTSSENDLTLTSSYDSIPEMVEAVTGAVVSVVVKKDVPIYERYFEEFNPWGMGGGFAIPRQRQNGTEEREVGGGSGFIVTKDGLIVTNRHVVDDEEARYSILMNDGTMYDVKVLARDPQLDIAVLQIEDLSSDVELKYLSFGDSVSLRPGETVVAIGNALAEFRNSVSVGVVSGLSRSIVASDGRGNSETLREVIQTDAAINPGNSGGPLLNLRGEVVGVNVATSRGADNIGFALPVDVVKSIVESVEKTGTIVRPFLGVRYTMITPALKKLNNLTVEYGALIARGEAPGELAVMPGSPADLAGLAENDIILEIDGLTLKGTDLAAVLRGKEPEKTVILKVLSKGKEKSVPVTLTSAPQ